MKIVSTPHLCLAVILNSIGISSQSERAFNGTHHSDSSQRSVGRNARSRSPTLCQRFPGVLGYRFEDLEFIRLSPYCSPERVFELRTYVFPQNERIGLRTIPGILNPLPAGEQIVLSKPNGDICAMMEKKSNKHICLRAICLSVFGKPKRAKININTGVIKRLTEDESDECPVSALDQITKNYAVFRVDTEISHSGSSSQSRGLPAVDPDSSSHHCGPSSSSSSRHLPDTTNSLATNRVPSGYSTPIEPPIRDRSRSPTLRQTFPTLLGYKFDDLGSIRLSPHNFPHRIFELRIYAFPPDKPIGLRTANHVLTPMPTGDQIVLSTSNGDVYAILQKKSNRGRILRPIFTSNLGVLERVKISMSSGGVVELNTEENAECPVNFKDVITKNYRIFHV